MRKLLQLKRFLQLAFCLLLAAIPASATTYYVSNSGSDSNNGTATGTPWQTVAKVNASSFAPGDSILFNRGGVWREQLDPDNQGAPGNPITYGAYGSGALPIITAGVLITSWTSASGLHHASEASEPVQVFYNGTRLTQVSSQGAVITGTWFWDATNSYVWIYDNPTGNIVEYSALYTAAVADAVNYTTLTNLEFTEGYTYDIYWVSSTGLTVGPNVTLLNSGEEGIRVSANTSSLITYATIEYSQGNGISTVISANTTIDHVTANYNCQLETAENFCAGIKANGDGVSTTNSANWIVQYSEACYNGVGQPLYAGDGIWWDTIDAGTIIQYNYVCGNNLQGIEDDDNGTYGALIQYNVVWGNSVGNTGANAGILVTADAGSYLSNHLVYGNTVYGNTGYGIILQGNEGLVAGGCTNNIVQNNLSLATIGGPNLLAQWGCSNDGTYGSGNVYTYNGFGVAAAGFIQWNVTGSGGFSTYASWEAASGNCGTTGCSHSMQSSPNFVNASVGNFALQAGSPGIGAGVNIPPTYTQTTPSFLTNASLQLACLMSQSSGFACADAGTLGNNLTNNNVVPTSSPTSTLGCPGPVATFTAASSQSFSLTNAAMTANFPGKNGTTTNSMTWGACVNYSSSTPGTNQIVMSEGAAPNYLIGPDFSSAVACSLYDSAPSVKTIFSNANLTVGTWYQVECLANAGTLTMYINGILQTQTTTYTPPITTDTDGFYVGQYAGGGDYFNGGITQVNVFDAALNGTQINQIGTGSLGGTLTGFFYNQDIQASSVWTSSVTLGLQPSVFWTLGAYVTPPMGFIQPAPPKALLLLMN